MPRFWVTIHLLGLSQKRSISNLEQRILDLCFVDLSETQSVRMNITLSRSRYNVRQCRKAADDATLLPPYLLHDDYSLDLTLSWSLGAGSAWEGRVQQGL